MFDMVWGKFSGVAGQQKLVSWLDLRTTNLTVGPLLKFTFYAGTLNIQLVAVIPELPIYKLPKLGLVISHEV